MLWAIAIKWAPNTFTTVILPTLKDMLNQDWDSLGIDNMHSMVGLASMLRVSVASNNLGAVGKLELYVTIAEAVLAVAFVAKVLIPVCRHISTSDKSSVRLPVHGL